MVLEEQVEELRSSYDTSRREHSSRSTYQRAMLHGSLSLSGASPASATILASSGANFMSKLKRIQATVVVPKTTTAFAGWFGFLRQPEGLTLATDQDFGDAAILRPSVFVSNTDNASYWTAYLPAVNITGTGRLVLIAKRLAGTGNSVDYVVRYVEERGV